MKVLSPVLRVVDDGLEVVRRRPRVFPEKRDVSRKRRVYPLRNHAGIDKSEFLREIGCQFMFQRGFAFHGGQPRLFLQQPLARFVDEFLNFARRGRLGFERAIAQENLGDLLVAHSVLEAQARDAEQQVPGGHLRALLTKMWISAVFDFRTNSVSFVRGVP